MDLPVSVTDLGEQLRGDREIVPDPGLFSDPQVFAAERERIFQRSVMALDHATRLSEDGRWFRCDAATRSILVTREVGGRLNALRNVCIHAGYPVCEAEEGSAERLMCPYHGWEFALDGRLVEPELSSRIDPARLRLASYPVRVCNGLIFADPPGATATAVNSVPAWLTAATVVRRARYNTSWNWKYRAPFFAVVAAPLFRRLTRRVPRNRPSRLAVRAIGAGGSTPRHSEICRADRLSGDRDDGGRKPARRRTGDWLGSCHGAAERGGRLVLVVRS